MAHHKEDCEQVKAGKAPCPDCLFSETYYQREDGEVAEVKHKSKKNTRKWCKGKEGREHKPIWVDKSKYEFHFHCEYVCQACQKILNSYREWKDESSLHFLSDNKYYERPTIGSSEPLKKKEKND